MSISESLTKSMRKSISSASFKAYNNSSNAPDNPQELLDLSLLTSQKDTLIHLEASPETADLA